MIESAHWRLGDGGLCGKPVDDEHEALSYDSVIFWKGQ